MEINIIIGECDDKDIELFFGPLEKTDIFHRFPANTRSEDIAKELGLFKSKSDARKNNFHGLFDKGFSKFVFGKLKNNITILNLSDETWSI